MFLNLFYLILSFSLSLFSGFNLLRSFESSQGYISSCGRFMCTNEAEKNKIEDNVNDTAAAEMQAKSDLLLDENKKLLESVKDLDDKYKRALAEAENTRVRMRKQLDDTKIYAIQGFCKDLLDVADVFNTAIDSVPKDKLKDNSDFKNLFDGVVMTEQQLQSVFRRHGLVPINPIGIKFNPNEHHAMFEVEDASKEPGSVSVVTKIGYKLHERTIRPAMVGVVKSSK